MYKIISTEEFIKKLHSYKVKEFIKNEIITGLEYLSESPFGYGKETGLSVIQELKFIYGKIWYDVDSQNKIVILHTIEIHN